jgi:transcriptional regulator with XRE-family HTH domain
MDRKQPLPEYLKQKRTEAGLTQAGVAETLGYSTAQFISNWERGESVPPIGILKSLAELYKIPPQELFEHLVQYILATTEQDLIRKFRESK